MKLNSRIFVSPFRVVAFSLALNTFSPADFAYSQEAVVPLAETQEGASKAPKEETNPDKIESPYKVREATTFTAQQWTTGLHMLAGLGVNGAYLSIDETNKEAGIGLNINTSVGYFFLNNFSLEANTNVMFNQVDRLLIWNTLGTLGVRVRLPTYLGPNNSHPYFKLDAGRGPSVLIFKGEKPAIFKSGGDRTQLEGDILSASYGIFENARDGTTWFIEVSGTIHSYRKIETVRDNLTVPEVIASRPVTNNAAMYAIALTFGVVVF